MEKWEYTTMKIETKGMYLGGKVDLAELEEKLKFLGEEGWELVSTTSTSMIFGVSREFVCIFKRKRA